jgi:anti-sigma regulatory factor (Ser/Thr protein kinase)
VSAPVRGPGGVHEAVLYSSPADLAAVLAPRIDPALTAREPVVAVLDEANTEALRAALGSDAGRVEFQDPGTVHRVPAFTVAVRWTRRSRRGIGPGGRSTVVAQHVDGLPGIGPEHWARLDIALDVAMEGVPLTMLCPYPTVGADLDRVRATHPRLFADGASHPSETYRLPQESVIQYPPPPPPDLGAPDVEMHFDALGLVRLRHLVAEVGVHAGLGAGRVSDVVLAVNEVASNSVEHGPGRGRMRAWTTGGGVIVEVADDGHMDVAFPGLTAPPPQGDRGRGLWLASELGDVLQVWSDEGGTIVRVHTDR